MRAYTAAYAAFLEDGGFGVAQLDAPSDFEDRIRLLRDWAAANGRLTDFAKQRLGSLRTGLTEAGVPPEKVDQVVAQLEAP